jgi:imidazolonepropionase-like amidohydrolase
VLQQIIAIVGANVLSMQSPTMLEDHTVLVRDGAIASVGPSGRIQVPRGATVIDGRGKYLMPGLADFHVHIAERGDLMNYVRSGVTTIAQMGGYGALTLAWRDSIRSGSMSGPQIFVGFYINGPTGQGGLQTTTTLGDARNAVRDAVRRRFDFVKVYNSLTEDQYVAIMDEARTHRLPVLGHAVRSIGIERGLAMGQIAVVHAEEYTYAELQHRRDSSSVARAVAFTKKHDATLVPNLSAFDVITRQWGKPAVVDSFLRAAEAKDLSAFWRERWRNADYVTRSGTVSALPFLKRLTFAMQRGGVRLLLGTDSPGIPGMFAGASIHEELRLLVESGLTPYEALVAGTRAAGEFAERHLKSPPFGLIAPGHRADLVLLTRNPLEDVRHARAPLMVRGTWIPVTR